MRTIEYATPIQLSKLYTFSLTDQQVKLQDIPWDKTGTQNKLRRYFAKSDWHRLVVSINASSGSASGGVISFASKKAFRIGQNRDLMGFFIKLIDSPERALFAEYVLRTVGKAKVPKSIVVEFDWDGLPNDYVPSLAQQYQGTRNNFAGNRRAEFDKNLDTLPDNQKLLHMLFCDGLWSQALNEDADKQATLNAVRRKFAAPLEQRPKYAIVMKSFAAGRQDFDPFTDDPNVFRNPIRGRSYAYAMADMTNLKHWITKNNLSVDNTTLDDQSPDFVGTSYANYRNDADLKKYIADIFISKQILSNQDLMYKAGRVLAADTLIGNTDRFEATDSEMFNSGNVFFFCKKYHDRRGVGKDDNPLGVIDSDAFFPSSQPFGGDLNRYLAFVLENGRTVINDPDRGLPLSNLRRLFNRNEFKQRLLTVIDNQLFLGGRFMTRIYKEIYADDGELFNRRGTQVSFKSARDLMQQLNITSVNGLLQRPECSLARTVDWIWQGFIDAVNDFVTGERAHLQSMWVHLVGRYGINGDYSDFNALLARMKYMGKAVEAINAGLDVNHDQVVAEIAASMSIEVPLIAPIQEALNFGLSKKLVDESEVATIKMFLRQVDEQKQSQVITGFDSSSISFSIKADSLKKRIMCVNLSLLKEFAQHMESLYDRSMGDDRPLALKHAAIFAIEAINKLYISHFSNALLDASKPKLQTDEGLRLNHLKRNVPAALAGYIFIPE